MLTIQYRELDAGRSDSAIQVNFTVYSASYRRCCCSGKVSCSPQDGIDAQAGEKGGMLYRILDLLKSAPSLRDPSAVGCDSKVGSEWHLTGLPFTARRRRRDLAHQTRPCHHFRMGFGVARVPCLLVALKTSHGGGAVLSPLPNKYVKDTEESGEGCSAHHISSFPAKRGS